MYNEPQVCFKGLTSGAARTSGVFDVCVQNQNRPKTFHTRAVPARSAQVLLTITRLLLRRVGADVGVFVRFSTAVLDYSFGNGPRRIRTTRGFIALTTIDRRVSSTPSRIAFKKH